MAEETASEGNPNELDISPMIEDSADKVEMLREYWTEEKLNTATPLMPEIERLDEIEALFQQDWDENIEEVLTPTTFPETERSQVGGTQPTCPTSTFNTQRVSDRSKIPYSAVGKLYMTFNGQNFVGSAWTIKSSGVMTAGHCLYDHARGGYADNVMFVPQFHKGSRPVGRWAATQMSALKGWTRNGNDKFKYDLAAFKTDRPIGPKTGTLGWLANARPNQGCGTGIGYPAGSPFDGQEMWSSTGRNLGGSNPIKYYNNMTGGCSGGPIEIWRGSTPLANGVNSFRYRGENDKMYSPYFGNGLINLYKWLT